MTIQSEHRPATLPVRTDTLAKLIQNRRSVRKYLERPVPPKYIEQILESASWAPSPHGRQPWRFAVITSQQMKLRLAIEMGTIWRQNLQMDGQSAEIVDIRLEKSRQRIFNAPVIIIP
ncbi:MAG TPA: nitroreductase family protein, partial [Ktedonobacteraceae bacterium]|nr:nitroreductase family protein [Ktedonobacteraceae bacterium]